MNIPEELKYTKEHEWVRLNGDVAEIGITDFAQGELGDIVFVELPEIGSEVKQKEPFGTIEAVKAVSEMFSPVNGTVDAVNDLIEEDAGIINNDPYGQGWMIKVKISNPDEIDSLLDADQYKELITE
ncbi:MAG: glycine cleavage system protein GcvH [candidate division Zixibacteria bacterium]